MPEYLELRVRGRPDPVYVELENPGSMGGPVKGWEVGDLGERLQKCHIDRKDILKATRAIAAPGGRLVATG